MRDDRAVRLTLLGVGAMNSPRYRPAGLLVRSRAGSLVIDGGAEVGLPVDLDAWVVCDARAELMPQIRRLARQRGREPAVDSGMVGDVTITPMSVEHTSHVTYGYLLTTSTRRVGWAPELFRYPDWAQDLDLPPAFRGRQESGRGFGPCAGVAP